MDGAGDEFFAGAALAGDHHGGVGHGDAANHFEHLLHGGRFSDERVLVFFDGERGFCGGGCLHVGLSLEGGVDDDLEGEGELLFADEVEGAEAHGFDDGLRGSERAHEHDDGVGIAVPNFCQEVHPAEGFDVCFGEHDIWFVLQKQLVGLF